MPLPLPVSSFKLSIEATPQTFTSQVLAFAMNLVKKELLLIVEQSVDAPTREHIVIQDLIDNPKRIITLELLDSSGIVVDTVKYRDCVVVEHIMQLSYVLSGTAFHEIAFTYDKIEFGNGTQKAYASAMSVIGKP